MIFDVVSSSRASTPTSWVEAGGILSLDGTTSVNAVPVSNSQRNWQAVVGFGITAWQGGEILLPAIHTL
jgi:hypothetical protein